MAPMVARAADVWAATRLKAPNLRRIESPRQARAQRPLPWRELGRREEVVVATRQGLERHEGRDVLEVEPDAGGGGELGGPRGSLDPLPAAARPVEPVGDPHRSTGRAQVLHGDELGCPAPRGREAGLVARRRAAGLPAVAKVDWQLAAVDRRAGRQVADQLADREPV